MSLPRLMIITDRTLMQPDFEAALMAAISGGARLFQLREKKLLASGVLRLALETQKICEDSEARLLVNANIESAQKSKAFGVHLPESQSMRVTRRSLSREYSVGQSVHSLQAAENAESAGADYLVFGSVFPTLSHSGSTPAGLGELEKVTRGVSIPVFAVGGISAFNARACLDAGAHGVAVIRAIWSTPDVETATRELVRILET